VPESHVILYFNIEYVCRKKLGTGRDVKLRCISGSSDLTGAREKNITILSIQETDRPSNAMARAVLNVRLYGARSVLHVCLYALREVLQWEGIEGAESFAGVRDVGIGYGYAKRGEKAAVKHQSVLIRVPRSGIPEGQGNASVDRLVFGEIQVSLAVIRMCFRTRLTVNGCHEESDIHILV
jgi:hypothetical protein